MKRRLAHWGGITALIVSGAMGCVSDTPPAAPPALATDDLHEADVDHRERDPHIVVIDDSVLTINGRLAPGPDEQTTQMWVRRAGLMLQHYYGRFSVPDLEIELITSGFGGVSFGIHYGGRKLRIFRGVNTSIPDMESDWVLLHEMLHTAFPLVPENHRWMREGLSTYLESIIRAQAGVIDEAEVWTRFIERMPQGLPEGTRGLVENDSWANLYWGGALFWLIADVRIREATAHRDNPMSLQEALRAVLQRGGNGRRRWEVRRILEVGDEATGTTVLRDLYRDMALAPIRIDLDAFFLGLGVLPHGDSARFDPTAKNAALRRAMTRQTQTLPSF